MKRSTGRLRRGILGLVCMLCLCFCIQAGAEKVLTLTFTGDCTLGCEEYLRGEKESFPNVVKSKGMDWCFAKFSDFFREDDWTVINLECVLSDSVAGDKSKQKRYCFRGDTEYVRILQDASVEVAGLANNHTLDFAKQGLQSTTKVLEEAGIAWCRGMDICYLEKDGIRIALIAIDEALYYAESRNYLNTMDKLKASGEANAIIVLFHSGHEYDAKHSEEQKKISENAIKHGADLVIMHHSHVLQGIHLFNNRTMFYSLGNFVFGGNNRIRTKPYYRDRITSSQYSMVVRARLYFYDDGTYKGQQMLVFPAYSTSAEPPENNFQPRRVNAEEAEEIREIIQFDTTDFELPAIHEDEEGLTFMVLDYLPSGEEPAEGPGTNGEPEPAEAKPHR